MTEILKTFTECHGLFLEQGDDNQSNEKEKTHGVLISPIDQLSNHNGNGPQQKKVKGLRQGSMRSGQCWFDLVVFS